MYAKGCGVMIKMCEICNERFNANNNSRIYCYKCSGDSTRLDNETRKHQKTILRRSMKIQAIKLLGGRCSVCGYDRCVDALEFHHKNPEEKEFKLGSGNYVGNFCSISNLGNNACHYICSCWFCIYTLLLL